MTVRTLIQMLKKYPMNTKLIVSSDEEGNGYSTKIDLAYIDDKLCIYPMETILYEDLPK